MFDVLAFVYENYGCGDACPHPGQMERRLSAQGFDAGEIHDALHWLDGLRFATQGLQGAAGAPDPDDAPAACQVHERTDLAPSPHALRVYLPREQALLGAHGLGYLCFLESTGLLPARLREIVLDRVVAADAGEPLRLQELKIVVLMVHWSSGIEPDALMLDELCDDASDRIAH